MTEKEKKTILIEEINKLLKQCTDMEMIDLVYVLLANNVDLGSE
jgi:hypothetical protein